MDTFTHGLAGYVIARTGLAGDTGKWGAIAGVFASLFPDADGILGPFFGTEFYLRYHRGVANSIFFAVPFSLLFAWLFVRISGRRRFRTFFLLCLVEILVHTFLDLITSFGTMILSPFSHERFALDWVFIIDLPLAAAFLLPIISLLIWRRRAQRIARVSVSVAALYIALCACSHFWALSLARAHARERGLVASKVASLPQPLSPFHWANYIVTQEKIYEGFVNLIGAHARESAPDENLFGQVWARYQPIDAFSYRAWERSDGSPWVSKALSLKGVRTYLWFARFPVARGQGGIHGEHRVSFFDLRFGAVNGRRPFVYEVVFDREGSPISQGYRQRLSPGD
jgi:inner membrane protein